MGIPAVDIPDLEIRILYGGGGRALIEVNPVRHQVGPHLDQVRRVAELEERDRAELDALHVVPEREFAPGGRIERPVEGRDLGVELRLVADHELRLKVAEEAFLVGSRPELIVVVRCEVLIAVPVAEAQDEFRVLAWATRDRCVDVCLLLERVFSKGERDPVLRVNAVREGVAETRLRECGGLRRRRRSRRLASRRSAAVL